MRNNDEIIEIISQNLSAKDMSVSELSRRVGMAKSAVSRYMNKTREFPLNRAEDFARALNISTEYLLGFDNKSNNEDTIAAHFDKDDLTEDEMKEVEDFINYLKSKRK